MAAPSLCGSGCAAYVPYRHDSDRRGGERHSAVSLAFCARPGAVLFACSTLFYLGKMMVHDDTPLSVWLHKGLPMLVLLVLFLVQILYIVRVQSDTQRTTHDGCSNHVRVQTWALGVFAVVQIGVGVWVAVRG